MWALGGYCHCPRAWHCHSAHLLIFPPHLSIKRFFAFIVCVECRLERLASAHLAEVWQLLLEEGQLLLPPGLLVPGLKYSLVFQPSGPGLPQSSGPRRPPRRR